MVATAPVKKKTRKARTPRVVSSAVGDDGWVEVKPADLPHYEVPKDLPDDERALLERARKRLQRYEKRMLALVRAASERWMPSQSLYETDETNAVVFGDDEYADFIAHVDMVSEVMMFRLVAGYLGVPRAVMDTLVLEKLRGALMPQARPFVVRRARGDM